ncbi:MAG: folate-binding protein YgfZ [Opitutaceae bacterium]|nr:folate-binding protein YgfZ [Opitutaceae bacterium]
MPTASEMEDTLYHRTTLAARLRVTGSDAATFLQGQFSNDLRRAEPGPATYGLWLNHKGRALAESHVLQLGANEFEVVSLTSPADTIRVRLESYVIADDVVVEDQTPGSAALLIVGAGAGEAVRLLGMAVPAARCFAVAGDLTLIPARMAAASSWCVFGPAALIDDAAGKLTRHGARGVERAVLDRGRIAAGVPVVPDELGSDDLPMEGGLEHDAISFTKGCYLGQEVMARLHNLGQVRRRLFIVTAEAGVGLPAKGTVLYAGSQKVGEIRAAVAAGTEGGAIGLAMLQTHAVDSGTRLGLEPSGPASVRVERRAEGRAP